MHTEILISFIVPMYNPDMAQLEECLRSISQIRQKMEVILIDDGSENTKLKSFCYSFIETDDRFRYFYQKNGGVSAARNLGLLKARGKFVSFVDADDSINGAALNQLDFNTLKDAELVVFDLYEVYPEGNEKRRELFSRESGFIDREEIIRCFITTSKLYECWGKLFCTDIIKRKLIYFPYGVRQGEDVIFNCMYFQHISRVYYSNESFYYYKYTTVNTTQRFINDPLARLNDIFDNYQCLLALIKKTFALQEQRKYIKVINNDYICGFGSRLLLLAKYKLINREVKKFIRCEVKPLLYKDEKGILLKSPKAFVYNLIIKNNLWLAFDILKHFKAQKEFR